MNYTDGTGYNERPPRPIIPLRPDGPWRCEGVCGELIYNLEVVRLPDCKVPQRIPRPGTPTPLMITGVGIVCNVCWDLYHTVNNHMSVEPGHPTHWFRAAHDKWKADKDERERVLRKNMDTNHYL